MTRGYAALAGVHPLALSLLLAPSFGAAESETGPAEAVKPAEEASQDWQRTSGYVPPDAEAFFPDDPEAGGRLDRLFRSRDRDARSDEEILGTVRSGLRRTRQHRTLVLAWIGNKYVWNKSPQHPDAVEIMYHAADFRGEHADVLGTRHYAVYFGLSVVKPKTPAILRTLADLCVRVDDPNDLHRVAWGAADQRAELLSYLRPHLESDDAAIREKAAVVERIFKGELEAFAWAEERARQRAEEKFAGRLPEIRAKLVEGTSGERRETMQLIARERIDLILDESFVAAFADAGKDKDPEVREAVATWVGQRFLWSAEEQSGEAIELALTLSKDEVREVRYDAVYFGLSVVREKDERVVRRLLEIAFVDREPNMYHRITWGLRDDRETAERLLRAFMAGDDPDAARAAREVYRDIVGREAPVTP